MSNSKKYKYDHPYAKEKDEYIEAKGWDIERDKKNLEEIKKELDKFQARYIGIRQRRTQNILIIVFGIIASMVIVLLFDRFEGLHSPINQFIFHLMGNTYPSDFAIGFITEMLGTLITFIGIELAFFATERAIEKEKIIYGEEIRKALLHFQILQAVMDEYLLTFHNREIELAESFEQEKINQEEYDKRKQKMTEEHTQIGKLMSYDYENLKIF